MHWMLPSSLARFSQPSRAKSKNGLFIAFGTITKREVWANAGVAIIATVTAARQSFLIGSLHTLDAYPDNLLFREVDRRTFFALPARLNHDAIWKNRIMTSSLF